MMTTQIITGWPLSGLTNEVNPAIEFTCYVEGIETMATLTHIEDNYVMHIYHVSFSDGHKAVFFFDEEERIWIEEGVGPTSYAEAVGKDLQAINRFVFSQPWMRLWPTFEVNPYNIWVTENKEGYAAIYDGYGQFYFSRGDNWQVKPFSKSPVVDENVMLFVRNALQKAGKL